MTDTQVAAELLAAQARRRGIEPGATVADWTDRLTAHPDAAAAITNSIRRTLAQFECEHEEYETEQRICDDQPCMRCKSCGVRQAEVGA